MKTFYAKTANMDTDAVDEQILDVCEQVSLTLTEDEIDDDMRQQYVDISFDATFLLDAIIFGEDYYVRNINKKMANFLRAEYGK